MRLKVCHVIPTLVQGGAEKQMSLLARHLDRDRFESEVVLLTHSGPLEQALLDADIPVHLIGKRGKLDPTAFFRLQKKLAALKPHIVHTWLFAANSYGRVAAHRAKVPIIVAGERCVDPWKTWWHHRIDRFLLRYTKKIVTNTPAIAEFYSEHGIPPHYFEVIPNAVVPSKDPKISREELCKRLGIEPRRRIVGAVGRLWKQKGYEDLVWAGELLRVAYEDVWVVIIGDGPDLAKLQHFRDQAHAQNAVKFVGHRSDATELMSAMDLLWNGSLYEGQSNTILEAMSLGVPVIASDIPGNRDLVKDGQTGHLYPLGDVDSLTRKTFALLKDDARREAMSRSARERIESEFGLEKMLSAHAALYERLWAEHQGQTEQQNQSS